MTETIFFYVFSGISILGVLLMLVTKNVIHAAYGLAIVLLSIAGIFVLLNAEYLAVVQIFMYAGGIVVILVFGIMLVNREKRGAPTTENRSIVLPAICSLVLFYVVARMTFSANLSWNEIVPSGDQTTLIGKLFLTEYLIAFEVIALLLLGVLVGAAFLAKKSTEND